IRDLIVTGVQTCALPILVDGAFDNEPVVVGLTTLAHHDEYTYAHAVNATMVAVTMAHFLGLDRRALADIGVAALFHDVGKSAVRSEERRVGKEGSARRET